MPTGSYASRTDSLLARSVGRRGSTHPKSPISPRGAKHMAKLDPTVSTVTAAAVLAVATSVLLNQFTPSIGQTTPASAAAQSAETTAQRPQWAASATGRVEPKDSEIRLIAEVPAKIVEVLAKNNDSVSAGDLLVRLDS